MSAAFGLAVFCSASLLFMVQPMVCKALLPYFGGAPAVWTACMLTFQLLLFAGYAYADIATRFCKPAVQALLHVGLLAAAMGFDVLPTMPGDSSLDSGASNMAGKIVLALLTSVGIPFFVLSTSAPLLQAWFARATPGRSPYFLYVLSNTGSLAALLGYPFLVEPWFPLHQQVTVWRWVFAAFAALLALLAAATWRAGQVIEAPVADREELAPQVQATASTYVLWFALAFVPSVLLLATTNQVCLDVASVPFMWVLPLSLYLLSFVLGFNQASWNKRGVFAPICCLAAVLFVVMLNWSADASILQQVGGYFLALFACCMFCHGELARLRPPPAQLTSFYLIMSAAGAAGGIFVSLLAPWMFNSYFELQLAVVAALALAIAVWYRNRVWPFNAGSARSERAIVAKLVIGGLSLAVVASLMYAEWRGNSDVVYQTRSFFGVLRVVRRPQPDSANDMLSLRHGRISHGTQYLAADKRRIPTSYYTRQAGVGLVLRTHHSDRPRRLGMVGLGTGTLAAYGRPGDQLTFYEIDADVERIAREHFTYLKDCTADWNVKLGDGRQSLEQESPNGSTMPFDVLVLDAFSGDAIPTHLITREAVGVYLDRLASDGILAFHISNRHLNLRPVLAASARSYQLASRVIETKDIRDMPASIWVLLSRDAKVFDNDAYIGTSPLDLEREIPWTDHYCSLASVLYWGSRDAVKHAGPGRNSPEVDRALELIAANDLRNAESILRDVVQRDQRDAGAWMHLGNVLRQQLRRTEAINAYRRAVEASPRYAEAHNNLGMLLFKIDRQKGRQHVVEAIRLDPRNVDAHNNLGFILAEESDLPGALRQFDQALAIDPDSDAARKNSDVIRSMLRTSSTP